ncbi:hypothetical protein, partial [Xanthobacter agilis]|uniref:hypothetical protein n=1 Tax=Xanthobacter agilis TaxID=47492 RepID=UPI003726EA2F
MKRIGVSSAREWYSGIDPGSMARDGRDQARNKHGFNKFSILDPALTAGWLEGFSSPLAEFMLNGPIGGGFAPEVWAPGTYVTPIIDASAPTIETFPVVTWGGWTEGFQVEPAQPTVLAASASDSSWSWSATLNSINWQYVAIGAGVAAVGLAYATGVGEIVTAEAIGLAALTASGAAAASTDTNATQLTFTSSWGGDVTSSIDWS